ncbi:CNP1-like family protein [Nitrosomonas ureae]|uniref:CNP1-like family protein n=1 Tax=Nitrosomonas ureae TaxID=44577 RepID=A0A286A4L1_9PROT|nr:CNP1-like family protein [Nitrosomonas ureae]SOD16855.1 CNP1-like family protein [Nitrosomonas ureae]
MKRICILLCLLLLACAKPPFKDQFESDKPWVEQLAQLPAYPDATNLMEFDAGVVSGNQYLVDPTSINIGEDGVIRFTLVVKSSAGALNVSYEGIRCATSERKLYALGRDDKTWIQPRASEWQKIELVQQFNAQRELAKNIFCPHRQIVTSTEDAIQALKTGIHRTIYR